ncbi:Phage EaA protein [Klebsiella pneumoniae ISC21]|nr:Phage EaA protein [Klebsiella pneumoniae ISC21]
MIVVGDDGGDALSYRRLIQSFEPGTKLYRHAQPAPAAPVAYSDFEEFWSAYIHPLAQDDELKDFAWDIWNACRAAILQHQPQNAPQNIPEIISGWIPVSERMPEDEQEVLTINKMGHRFVSFFDKHSGLFFDRLDAPAACCIEHVLVTHWMPLPAAPQEVR